MIGLGNFAQRLARFHRIGVGGGGRRRRRQLQFLPDIDIVWIADPVVEHQRVQRDIKFFRNLA